MYATAYIYTYCRYYTCTLYIVYMNIVHSQILFTTFFKSVIHANILYIHILYIACAFIFFYKRGMAFFIIYIWLCMLGCIYCLCMVIKVQYPHLHTFTRMVVFYTCQECTLTICTHSICIFKTMYTVHDIYHSTQSIMNIYVSMICIHAILSTSVL